MHHGSTNQTQFSLQTRVSFSALPKLTSQIGRVCVLVSSGDIYSVSQFLPSILPHLRYFACEGPLTCRSSIFLWTWKRSAFHGGQTSNGISSFPFLDTCCDIYHPLSVSFQNQGVLRSDTYVYFSICHIMLVVVTCCLSPLLAGPGTSQGRAAYLSSYGIPNACKCWVKAGRKEGRNSSLDHKKKHNPNDQNASAPLSMLSFLLKYLWKWYKELTQVFTWRYFICKWNT